MVQAARIKRSFAKSAKTYTRHAGLQMDVSRRLVHEFADAPYPPRSLLDIGCGTGFTSLDAARRWPNAHITAIDLAFPMAGESRNAGVRNVVVADAGALPFGAERFDAAVSSLAFQWVIPDNAALFSGIARVLKPGGGLYFATLVAGTLAELRQAYSLAHKECTGRDAVYPDMAKPEEIASLMVAGGFNNIRCGEWVVRRAYGEADDLFAALKGVGAAAAGRPETPPRRDVLARTRTLYPLENGGVEATYVVAFFAGER